MQYIVLDLEWNQPWPGSYSAKKVLPSPIRGEIVQIGAVRMPCEGTVADEFQTLIRPAYYKKMNRKVASLTGIKDAILKEQGKPFPEAMQAFHDWCGEDSAFLTWGFDDIVILKENLTLYGMDTAWVDKWYNAQLIFNAQTDGSSAQKALGSAMQIMGIEPTRPAHDALGDAYHTALICSRLRLAEGIDAYEKAAKEHENGFHGAELPGCVARHVSHGYADKAQALAAMAQEENVCPVCGGAMTCGKWYPQPGKRFMAMAACEQDGEFLVRVRLAEDPDGTFRANRLVYSPDSEAAESYRRVSEKPAPSPSPPRGKIAGEKDGSRKTDTAIKMCAFAMRKRTFCVLIAERFLDQNHMRLPDAAHRTRQRHKAAADTLRAIAVMTAHGLCQRAGRFALQAAGI